MTIARDLGSGPHRKFGSALPASTDKRLDPLSLVTERPIRLRSINGGRCQHCGSRFYGCCQKDLTDE